MSTTSSNLGLTLAETTDIVDVDAHIAANFATLDTKWSTAGTPAAVQVGATGTPGSSTVVSRSDHVHGITVGTPVSTSTSNAAGSNTTVSASDHVHKVGDNSVVTASVADLAITATKIASLTITSAQMASNSINFSKLATVNVPSADNVMTYDAGTSEMKWQAASSLVSPGAVVPSGLIAAFATAGAIASGWARYTTADGRFLVGAGTVFGVTWTENTDYGGAWNHNHTMQGHTHLLGSHNHPGSSASGVSGTTGGPSSVNTTGSSGNTSADGGHTHGFSASVSLSIASDNNQSGAPTGTGNTSDTNWVIPSHAVVWAQKT